MTAKQRSYVITEYLCGRGEPKRIAEYLGVPCKTVATYASYNKLTSAWNLRK